MFRHPNLRHIKGTNDDFALEKRIDQSIRYYKVPAMKAKEDVLNSLMDKINRSKKLVIKRNNTVRIYYAAASIAAAVLIIFSLYFTFSFETFHGVQDASNVYYLPDNSRVVLAEGASLRYSKLLYKRQVILKGEAYFEAVHEEGSTFYVRTREGGVMVLGTRFSVSSIHNHFVVQCYEGSIGIDYGQQKIKLTEGMKFVGKNSIFDVETNKNLGYPYYAHFNYTCANKQLVDIWPVIETYFGIEIIDNSNALKSFTGSINTGSIYEVMDIICTSMDMTFDISKNKTITVFPR
jgi:transmembrane sensor